MSLRETTLTDFQTPEPETTTDTDDEPTDRTVPDWAENNDWETNHQCNNCGSSVSPAYHAFHRDQNGDLRRCQNCKTQTDMKKGAGAVDDYHRRGPDNAEKTPSDSLFGPTDTSDMPDHMTGGSV